MPPQGNPNQPTRSESRPPSDPLNGLDPVGLLDGVLGGHASEWAPPPASELESAFPGFTGFEYIDRGAMGAIYAATQVSLQRRVAIKILPPEFGADATFVNRFQQEAQLLARLQHPHIVAVYDFGRSEQGGLYIVMEYVNGTSLLDIMQHRRIAVSEVLEIVRQTCLALQFAHNHGVVHRDIKPSNILLDDSGRMRVADFGLARLHLKENAPHASTHSSISGTPVYAAPEQMKKHAAVDHRCDLYSTGVTMFEMLTGSLPVGNFDPPSKKAATPVLLDKIVFKAMRENPDERHQTASSLAADIEVAVRRLSTPILNRAIAKRPIVSMMTTVIVTACLIYLFGEINDQVLHSKPLIREDITPPPEALIDLNSDFCLLNATMSWKSAQEFAHQQGNITFASLHSAAEVAEIMRHLHEKDLLYPVWIGGSIRPEDSKLEWADGSKVDFEMWMPSVPEPPLIITEVQAKNRVTWKTEDGTTPDWIEVHNPGTQPVNLHGWHLRHFGEAGSLEGRLKSKDGDANAIIAPGEYRVIASYPLKQSDTLHFDFQLEAQRGRINWSDPRGRVIQAFDRSWKDFPADFSFIADTTGTQWGWSSKPSPGKPNASPDRVIPMSSKPQPAASAVLLLPEFEGRWAMDMQKRTAMPLFRKKKK